VISSQIPAPTEDKKQSSKGQGKKKNSANPKVLTNSNKKASLGGEGSS
jgi:hypothetical protein